MIWRLKFRLAIKVCDLAIKAMRCERYLLYNLVAMRRGGGGGGVPGHRGWPCQN